jgi:hypothetical protein
MPKQTAQITHNSIENTSAIALNFIAFLTSEARQLERFCALTGATPDDLRNRLDSLDFLAMAMDYLLQDEALLLTFSASLNLSPAEIAASRRHLPGYAP